MKIKHIEDIFMKILVTENPPLLRFAAVSLSEQILMSGRHYDPQNVTDCFCNDTASDS